MKINWKKVAQVGVAVAGVTPAGPIIGRIDGAIRSSLPSTGTPRQQAKAMVAANFGAVLQTIEQDDADISDVLAAVTSEVEEWLIAEAGRG